MACPFFMNVNCKDTRPCISRHKKMGIILCSCFLAVVFYHVNAPKSLTRLPLTIFQDIKSHERILLAKL